MRATLLFLFISTASAFGIPQSSPVPTPTVYDPCSTDSGQQMYPHRLRRSLSLSDPDTPLLSRQFVAEEVIPGQGPSAPKPPPPSAKYIISDAIIVQGSTSLNGTQQVLPERFAVDVTNASDGSLPFRCTIDWNAALAGQDSVAYQLTCENYAFCVILQQAAPAPQAGFYLYVALP